jgi:ribosome maturation protein Sdo1
MAMTKARTKMNGTMTRTEDRPEVIRRAIEEMGELLIEKNRARDRIRALVRRVHSELGIPAGDFVMGVRMNSLAKERKQQTVNNLREIMFAMGNSLPSIAPPATPTVEVSAPVYKRDLIVQVLTTHGPMKEIEIRQRLGSESSVAGHLSHLKTSGRVKHRGTQWSVP